MIEEYAKPYTGEKGTYRYHVGECYRLWKEIFESRTEALQKICTSVNIDLEEFRDISMRAVLLHDAGKLLPTFQQQMQLLIDKKPLNQILYFRHEVASALLLLILNWERLKDSEYLIPFDIFAVLGHHKSLQIDWHTFEREKSHQNPPSLNEHSILRSIEVAEINGLPLEIDIAFVARVFSSPVWPEILFRSLTERLEPTMLANITASERKNIRLVYALIKGLLMNCDWLASAKPDERIPVNHQITNVILRKKIKKKIEREAREYKESVFHRECEKEKGNILAIAPTGTGKTEAALLWATNREPSKIIFLMPTMVTSNSIYDRLNNYYFDEKDCGLTHSSADTYFVEQMTLKHEKTQDDVRLALHQFQAFMAPVMVSTIDQMLTSGLNIGSWCQKEWALVGSRVIIDEIHAYQAYTMGLITASLEKINILGGTVCLMSATMPAFLQNHFLNVLDLEAPIVAEDLMNRRKCYWEYRETLIETMTEEIQINLQQERKVAIIFNTVRAAQEAFRKWREVLGPERVVCYHSQFIMGDRQDIEKNILNKDNFGRPKKYDLVIATQAIEVSLDINFDVIYSECAPLDSLIQRAGRCNRYNADGDYSFIVFPASKIALDFVYKSAREVMNRTEQIVRKNQKRLSEHELVQMLEYVYEGYKLDNNSEYMEGYNLYEVIATNIKEPGFIFDLSVREDLVTRKLEGYLKTNIIPQVFYGEVKELWENRKFASLRLYEVPIAEYRRRKLKLVTNSMQLPIYEVPYAQDEGVLDSKDDFLTII